MIKKIAINQLAVGMYIAEANNDWIPAGATVRKGVIKSADTIEKIKKLGEDFVYIDTEKGIDSAGQEGLGGHTVSMPPHQNRQAKKARQSGVAASMRPTTSLKEERERAGKLHSHAKELIGGVLDNVKNGKGVDARVISNMADELTDSLDRNVNALSCLSRIREKDSYLLEHSVNVGILLGLFARSMKYDRTRIAELVTAGILHDIGKILVPDEVLNKPGRLEDDEWEEMKRHVVYGEQVLSQTEGLPDVARTVCVLHHERLDGSGYPRNLKGQDICRYGRMAAIVDVYDAITADRVYHKGVSPNEALKKLIDWSVFHLDKDLVYSFIRCVSIYPVGTVVELDTGCAGVVIEANPIHPKRPILRVFYNVRHNHYLNPYVLDMSSGRTTEEIVGTVDTGELNIKVGDFL